MKSTLTTNLVILYNFRQLGFQHREHWSIVGLLLPTLVHEVVSGIVVDKSYGRRKERERERRNKSYGDGLLKESLLTTGLCVRLSLCAY